MLPKREWAEMTWAGFRADDARRAGSRCCRSPRSSSTARICRSASIPISRKPIWRACASCCRRIRPRCFYRCSGSAQSDEHVAFPGTLTLSAATVLRALIEIGESVARAGVRKLVMINSHGGNITLIDLAARQLRVRHGMLVVRGLAPLRLSGRRVRRRGAPARHPWRRHRDLADAGRVPGDLVRREASPTSQPGARMRWSTTSAGSRAYRPAGFGWMTQDLHPSGTGRRRGARQRRQRRAAPRPRAPAFFCPSGIVLTGSAGEAAKAAPGYARRPGGRPPRG